MGTISAFAYRHRETKKNLCRGGRSQDLPNTDLCTQSSENNTFRLTNSSSLTYTVLVLLFLLHFVRKPLLKYGCCTLLSFVKYNVEASHRNCRFTNNTYCVQPKCTLLIYLEPNFTFPSALNRKLNIFAQLPNCYFVFHKKLLAADNTVNRSSINFQRLLPLIR